MPAATPRYGGMLDLAGHSPVARCTRCGWEGVPTFWRGRKLDACPCCEMRDADAEWLAIFESIARDPLWRRLARCPGTALFKMRPARSRVKQSRNSPCACGSGKKHKRCCGR